MFKTTVIIAATLFGQTAVAQTPMAQTGAPIRATLASPVAKDGAVKALATSWSCTGVTCTGPAINGRFGDPRACREIVKVAGAVTAFSGLKGDLAAEDLARCNKSAKTAG